jgi:hypothetical protein
MINDVSRWNREESASPLLLASSSSPLSTSLAGRCTYLTTEPLTGCQPLGFIVTTLAEFASVCCPISLNKAFPLGAKGRLRTVGFDIPNEDVLDTAKVRVLELVKYGDVVELYVQILVNRFEGSPNRNVVLELNCHG